MPYSDIIDVIDSAPSGSDYGYDESILTGGQSPYIPGPGEVSGGPSALDLLTLPAGENPQNSGKQPFGQEAEKARRSKILAALLSTQGVGLSMEFLALLANALGIVDFGPIGGLEMLTSDQGARSAAGALGIPTLPGPRPGATQSINFLDWQPDNPIGSPSRFTEPFQLYRPDLIPADPNLVASILDSLVSSASTGVGGASSTRSSNPRAYKLTPHTRLGSGGGGGHALGASEAF